MRDGPTRLKRWLKKSGLSQVEFAERARLSESTVSLLLSGGRSPGLSAVAIEQATDGAVPANCWLSGSRAA